MARPTKQGIDYFPVDTDFDDNIEMYLIEKEAFGLAVLVTAWQLIYRNHGYYSENGQNFFLLIKKRISGDINAIKDCVNSCLSRGIFDKTLHKKFGILTSKGIQKRYFEAARKKKRVSCTPDFLLIDVNSYPNLVSVAGNRVTTSGNATNVKEEVKEEVKEKGKGGIPKPASVSLQVWQDFIFHRTKKKAPLTQTALEGFIREAKKAGITLEEALIETIERNWVGYRASWKKEESNVYNPDLGEAPHDQVGI